MRQTITDGLGHRRVSDTDIWAPHNSPEMSLLCGLLCDGPCADSMALIENHIFYKDPCTFRGQWIGESSWGKDSTSRPCVLEWRQGQGSNCVYHEERKSKLKSWLYLRLFINTCVSLVLLSPSLYKLRQWFAKDPGTLEQGKCLVLPETC